MENHFRDIMQHQLEPVPVDLFAFAYELRRQDTDLKTNAITLELVKFVKNKVFQEIIMSNFWIKDKMVFDMNKPFTLATGSQRAYKLHLQKDNRPYITHFRLQNPNDV